MKALSTFSFILVVNRSICFGVILILFNRLQVEGRFYVLKLQACSCVCCFGFDLLIFEQPVQQQLRDHLSVFLYVNYHSVVGLMHFVVLYQVL